MATEWRGLEPHMVPSVAPPPASCEGLSLGEVSEPAALEALQPEWAELFESCPEASPFQSPAWLLPWRRAFLQHGLWTLAVRRGGRLVGLAPFFIHDDHPGGARQLTLLGNGLSDRLDLLAAPCERQAVAERVFDHLAASRAWLAADLRDLPADSPLLVAPAPAEAHETVSAEPPCPVRLLPPQLDAVLAGLPKARRGDIRRCARRLAEIAPLTFETADAASRREHLAALAALHAARWRERGEPGVLAEPGVMDFHDQATEALLAAGMLRLHSLRLGQRIIAVHYALRRGARAYSYLHAFDPELAALGPGWVLMARSLEAAVAEGAREFDFLRGQEAYKYDWGASDQPQFRRRIWR